MRTVNARCIVEVEDQGDRPQTSERNNDEDEDSLYYFFIFQVPMCKKIIKLHTFTKYIQQIFYRHLEESVTVYNLYRYGTFDEEMGIIENHCSPLDK